MLLFLIKNQCIPVIPQFPNCKDDHGPYTNKQPSLLLETLDRFLTSSSCTLSYLDTFY
jgi:hypothetical protein